MAKIKVPYFTSRRRANGTRRHFWQPSATLRREGFALKRLSDIEAAAIAECQAETARVRAIMEARRNGTAGEAPAKTPRKSIDPDSVDAMIRNYKKSEGYLRLSPKTRLMYDAGMAELNSFAGDMPKVAITPKMVADWLANLRWNVTIDAAGRVISRTPRPAYAAAIGRVARTVYYADRLADGRVKSALDVALNPFAHQRLTSKPAERADPESILWSDDAIDAYVAAADAIGLHSVGTAITLDAWLGQRMNDVLRIPLDFLDEVKIRQGKTGVYRALPIDLVPHLQARVAAERAWIQARQAETQRVQAAMTATGRNAWPTMVDGRRFIPTLDATTLLISEATGLPYSVDHFQKKFNLVRDRVTADHPDRLDWAALTFMHLRHTAVTRLGEAGCDDAEISSISGHSLETIARILERYMVRTRKMARSAFRKRMAAAGRGDEE